MVKNSLRKCRCPCAVIKKKTFTIQFIWHSCHCYPHTIKCQGINLYIACIYWYYRHRSPWVQYFTRLFGSDFIRLWGFPVIFGYKFNKESVYILVILVLVGVMIATYNFMKSSTGRALIAMKKSEHAAQAIGVSLFKHKLLAFSLSTMYAGIAGSPS